MQIIQKNYTPESPPEATSPAFVVAFIIIVPPKFLTLLCCSILKLY